MNECVLRADTKPFLRCPFHTPHQTVSDLSTNKEPARRTGWRW